MDRVSGKLRLVNAAATAALAAAVLAPAAHAEDSAPPLSSVLPNVPGMAEAAAVVDAAVAAVPAAPAVAAPAPVVEPKAPAPEAASPAAPSQAKPEAAPETTKPDPAPAATASAPAAAPKEAAEAPKARDTTAATSAIAAAVDTAVNSAQYHAGTTQYQPSNIVVIVRIDSPGNDGPITQTNTAITSIVTTVTQTVESVAAAVAATAPVPLSTLPTPIPEIVSVELPPLLPPRIEIPALPPVPLPVITLGATPLSALPAQALPVPMELPVSLPGFDVPVPGLLEEESQPRAGPGPSVLGTTAAPVLLPLWVPAPSFRAGSSYSAAGSDETSARQRDRGAHAVPPAAERPAPQTIPTQRVAASAAPAAAGGAGAGAAAVALIFAILAAYALVPPGGFRRLRRIRVRTPSGVDGARRDRPG